MARALPLSAYLALHRGRPGAFGAPGVPRPSGVLIWVHCPDPARIAVVTSVAQRLLAEGDRLTLLVTCTDIPANTPALPQMILQPVPPESRAAVRVFLDHWRPDLLVWLHGDLRPVLLSATEDPALPRLLADIAADHVTLTGGNWMPGLTGAVLDLFDCALVHDHAAAARLRTLGMPTDRIEVAGPLEPDPPVLPCNEAERRDLAQVVGPRPVWLAADLPLAELDAVISAHRLASRRAHRLLLLIVPSDPAAGPEIVSRLRDEGLIVACRASGDEPDEPVQVYLSDNREEMGLWYRLSPITYLGGTLTGPGGRHPYEPAALGSAVLHGPVTDGYTAAYALLSGAGAVRAVRTAMDLGHAVEVLLAPDRTAAMAHAAWDVTSRGANVTNRLAELIRVRLDRLGA
ncbi:MAG: 3-deoxy-D-manno-octulosonic acid transferase [Rhodobacterales bacterium]|nr:3-deoxy-D-manno-octulosonic acid transferase [Rhodobacterales bacterium]NCT13311.1 3-deoxy-D-manno-octulosonic acid transferase [Rhodobacterales bacterium]